jgi:hypothetical protein
LFEKSGRAMEAYILVEQVEKRFGGYINAIIGVYKTLKSARDDAQVHAKEIKNRNVAYVDTLVVYTCDVDWKYDTGAMNKVWEKYIY